MATTTRVTTRSALRSLRSTTFRTNSLFPVQSFRQLPSRGYASSKSSQYGRSGIYLGATLAAIGGAAAYWVTVQSDFLSKVKGDGSPKGVQSSGDPKNFIPKFEDYQKVYDVIAAKLDEQDDYDDGSFGPVVLRLGWHASGTYDKDSSTGGSNGATMRFAPESDHGANAGLALAREFLEPVKKQFPWITYSDLWTLAAVTAIQEMQGPKILWRPGRVDGDVSSCTPDGRLPDASKSQNHLRAIFNRMGFNDQEIVALSGAHALGRCHTDRSGYEGPWTFSPTTLTNDYFKLLINEKWNWRKWKGPYQFEDSATKSLMMLPTDMALVKDKKFRPWVEKYANDNEAFFKDFSDVVMRLFELGVPFKSSEDVRMKFKSSFD